MLPRRLRLITIGLGLAAIVVALGATEGVSAVLFAAPLLMLFSALLGGWYVGEDAILRRRAAQAPRRRRRAAAVKPAFAGHLLVPLSPGPHLGSLQRRGPPRPAAA